MNERASDGSNDRKRVNRRSDAAIVRAVRGLPAPNLQGIVDYVAAQVEPKLGTISASEKALTAITFTSGISVNYPNWMLTRPGHGLLPIYQSVFGQHLVTPPRLEKSFRRLRLVPVELAKIMAQLQQV